MGIRNIGGCDALSQKIAYKDRKREREDFINAGMPWWTSGKANLILVPIFSAMDGMVLFSIFDECLTQSVFMGSVMAFGVAVVLNILPLIIARFVHEAFDKTTKNATLMMSIFITSFLLIYGGTVYLRFSYSDMYGQENQSVILENMVSNEETYVANENPQPDNKKGIAVVVLLSISPLITSVLGFGFAYVSDDEIKKKVEYLEIQKVEIEEKISDTQAAISELEHSLNEGVKRDIDLDEMAMDAAIEEIVTRCNTLKALARFYLAEYLANPSATSKISQEMLTGADGLSEQIVVSAPNNESRTNNIINIDKVV